MSQMQIKQVLPWRLRIWWGKKVRSHVIRSISKVTHPHARDICRALANTITNNYSLDEQTLMTKIEHLREVCLNSSKEIEFMDYGAGEPADPQSWQESRQGVHKKISLSHLAKHTSKSEPWSSLLFNLVKEVRPQRCLELGTCIGFSASYQCLAMRLNGVGSLVTLEGAQSFAEVAREHLRQLEVHNYDIILGRFEDTLETVLTQHGPFDFMFNDGHHDGQAMLNYYEKCLPSFSDNAVLLFDDICAYPSMQVAWHELCSHDRVALAIDFGGMGLLALGKDTAKPALVYQLSL